MRARCRQSGESLRRGSIASQLFCFSFNHDNGAKCLLLVQLLAMDMSSRDDGASTAGIVVDAVSGNRVVPESKRADGSIRKERRVKPGFVPIEDVARFRPSRVLKARAEEKSSGQDHVVDTFAPPTTASTRSERTEKQARSPAFSNRKDVGKRHEKRLGGTSSSVWAANDEEQNTTSRIPEWRRGSAKKSPIKDRQVTEEKLGPVDVLEACDQGRASVGEQTSYKTRTESKALESRTKSRDEAEAHTKRPASESTKALSTNIDDVADELASLGLSTKSKAASEET